MLQQCLSVNSCMRTCIVMEEHYIGCQHSMSFVLNGLMQFFFFCKAMNVMRCYITCTSSSAPTLVA
jgi:hypothetical protein